MKYIFLREKTEDRENQAVLILDGDNWAIMTQQCSWVSSKDKWKDFFQQDPAPVYTPTEGTYHEIPYSYIPEYSFLYTPHSLVDILEILKVLKVKWILTKSKQLFSRTEIITAVLLE